MFEPQKQESPEGTQRLMCLFKDVMLLMASPSKVFGRLKIAFTILEGCYYYSLKHLDSSNPHGVK